MVRSVSLLCLGASLLAAARVCAQDINFAATEENFFGLDDFDKGPSSGPFSNKPGWPKLDGPGEDEDGDDDATATPAPSLTLSAVTATAPASTTSAPTTPTPTTTAPATLAPTTQAPATIAPTTLAPTTSAPPSKAPVTAAPSVTPSMAPAQPKGSGVTSAPTTVKPAIASSGTPGAVTQTPQSAQGSAGDRSRCSKDSILVSVEGVEGSHCVPTTEPFCSAKYPSGNCPGPQSGLEQGSHCGRVKSGVYSCLPGARGSERINCHVDG